MKARGLSVGFDGKRVVVQGIGNVGYHAAKFCRERGARVVAVAVPEGAILDPKGLDEDAIVEYRRGTGSILGFRASPRFRGAPMHWSSTATC